MPETEALYNMKCPDKEAGRCKVALTLSFSKEKLRQPKKQVLGDSQPVGMAGFRGICTVYLRVTEHYVSTKNIGKKLTQN